MDNYLIFHVLCIKMDPGVFFCVFLLLLLFDSFTGIQPRSVWSPKPSAASLRRRITVGRERIPSPFSIHLFHGNRQKKRGGSAGGGGGGASSNCRAYLFYVFLEGVSPYLRSPHQIGKHLCAIHAKSNGSGGCARRLQIMQLHY